MISLPAPDNRLYLGKGGSGKTTLALHHAQRFDRELICNPNGEAMHREHADVTSDRAELVHLVSRPGHWRVCWEFSGKLAADFEWVNRVAWARGDLCLVWDECDLFMRHGAMPEEAYKLWNTGRHKRLRILALSRRPARVSPDVRANLARAVVFRMEEKRDLQFVGDMMGEDVALAVRKLPAVERPSDPRHAVDWTPSRWAVKKSLFA